MFINHAVNNPSSYDRFKNDIDTDTKKIISLASKKLSNEIFDKKKDEGMEILFKQIDDVYINKIRDIHFEVYPISKSEIREQIPKIFGIDPKNTKEIEEKLNAYKIIDNSKLLVNACCSKECPYFLKFTESLDLHISKATMPAFHKTIVLNLNKSPEEIFKHIINFDCVMKDGTIKFANYNEIIDDMNKNKDKYLNYIKNVIAKYKQM